MDGLRGYHTKWSKPNREQRNKISYDIVYMWNLKMKRKKKIQMKLFPKQKEAHRHRKQINDYQRGKVGGGIN